MQGGRGEEAGGGHPPWSDFPEGELQKSSPFLLPSRATVQLPPPDKGGEQETRSHVRARKDPACFHLPGMSWLRGPWLQLQAGEAAAREVHGHYTS